MPAQTLAMLLGLSMLVGCATSPASLTHGNSEIIRRYFHEWANGANAQTADELIAPDVVLRHPHVVVTGLDSYKQGLVGFRLAFPDLHFTVEDMVGQGQRVLVRWIMTGTQRGDFQGHAATGKVIRVHGMSLFRLTEGKIREIWVSQDRLGMQEQLGWIAVPGAGR